MNRRKVLIKQVKDWRRITSALDAKVEMRDQYRHDDHPQHVKIKILGRGK